MSQSEQSVDKYINHGLTKFANSEIVSSIYPVVNHVVVYQVDDANMIIVRIYVDDPELNEKNMYEKGLDPHYLIDYHLTKFFPYFSIPNYYKVGFAIVGPDDNVIKAYWG